jgi:hypothetical protein
LRMSDSHRTKRVAKPMLKPGENGFHLLRARFPSPGTALIPRANR